MEAQAEADAIRARGEAEAEAIRAKGLAEAAAKDRMAEAMKKYGDAAVVEMIVNQLPEIMSAVSKPMEQIEKITVIDNGGDKGASKVAKVVSDVALNGFEVLNDLTGVDVSELLRNFVEKSGRTKAEPPVEATVAGAEHKASSETAPQAPAEE